MQRGRRCDREIGCGDRSRSWGLKQQDHRDHRLRKPGTRAGDQSAPGRHGDVDRKTRECSGFAIVVGLIIVPRFFPHPYNLASLLARTLEGLSLISSPSVFPISNIGSFVLGSVLLMLTVRYWEIRQIKELGLSASWLRSVLI